MASESDADVFAQAPVEHQGGVRGGGGPSITRDSDRNHKAFEPVGRYELRSAGCGVLEDATRALHRGDAGGDSNSAQEKITTGDRGLRRHVMSYELRSAGVTTAV